MSNSVHKRHKLLRDKVKIGNIFSKYMTFQKLNFSKVEYLKNAFLQNLSDLHRATTFLLVTLLHR